MNKKQMLDNQQCRDEIYPLLPTGTGKLLELFTDSLSVGSEAETIKINLVKDIGKLTLNDVPFIPDIVWASPDCTPYTIAEISTHRNKTETKSDYAKKCNTVNKHFIKLIKEWLVINPNMVFFIENPRGMFRKMPSKIPQELCREILGSACW